MDIAKCMNELLPSAKWICIDGTYEELKMLDGTEKPAKDDLEKINSIVLNKEILNQKIQEAKEYLSSTDYKMTVDYFATLTKDVQDILIAKRQEAREFIRSNVK
jgi:hypothetical protein